MIKAVIFDMDGTLVDSEPVYERVRKNVLLREFGVEMKETPREVIGTGLRNTWAVISKIYHLDLNVDEYVKKDTEEMVKYIETHGLPLNEGVTELLTYLKEKDIARGIASSSKKDYVQAILQNTELGKYIETALTGDCVCKLKPAPDIYLRALEMMNVKAEEALVIEDATSGVQAAVTAGMRCIGFNAGEKVLSKQDFSSCYAIVNDMRDIISIIKSENDR